jgi:hypothetical protein
MTKETTITCKGVPEEDRVAYTILVGEKLTCVLPSPEAYDKLRTKVACLEDNVAWLRMKVEELEYPNITKGKRNEKE